MLAVSYVRRLNKQLDYSPSVITMAENEDLKIFTIASLVQTITATLQSGCGLFQPTS